MVRKRAEHIQADTSTLVVCRLKEHGFARGFWLCGLQLRHFHYLLHSVSVTPLVLARTTRSYAAFAPVCVCVCVRGNCTLARKEHGAQHPAQRDRGHCSVMRGCCPRADGRVRSHYCRNGACRAPKRCTQRAQRPLHTRCHSPHLQRALCALQPAPLPRQDTQGHVQGFAWRSGPAAHAPDDSRAGPRGHASPAYLSHLETGAPLSARPAACRRHSRARFPRSPEARGEGADGAGRDAPGYLQHSHAARTTAVSVVRGLGPGRRALRAPRSTTQQLKGQPYGDALRSHYAKHSTAPSQQPEAEPLTRKITCRAAPQ